MAVLVKSYLCGCAKGTEVVTRKEGTANRLPAESKIKEGERRCRKERRRILVGVSELAVAC